MITFQIVIIIFAAVFGGLLVLRCGYDDDDKG